MLLQCGLLLGGRIEPGKKHARGFPWTRGLLFKEAYQASTCIIAPPDCPSHCYADFGASFASAIVANHSVEK
jgi:hypothetical protein